jgi:hypothetical protein
MTSSGEDPRTAGAGACPGAEALAALAMGEGEPDERRAVADHVVACAACAADFRLLRELHHEALPAAPRDRRPARRAWLATAAAAAVGAVVLVPRLRPTEPCSPNRRPRWPGPRSRGRPGTG